MMIDGRQFMQMPTRMCFYQSLYRGYWCHKIPLAVNENYSSAIRDSAKIFGGVVAVNHLPQ